MLLNATECYNGLILSKIPTRHSQSFKRQVTQIVHRRHQTIGWWLRDSQRPLISPRSIGRVKKPTMALPDRSLRESHRPPTPAADVKCETSRYRQRRTCYRTGSSHGLALCRCLSLWWRCHEWLSHLDRSESNDLSIPERNDTADLQNRGIMRTHIYSDINTLYNDTNTYIQWHKHERIHRYM